MGKGFALVSFFTTLALCPPVFAAPSSPPVSGAVAPAGAVEAPVSLASHKAVYDLSLARAERGGIVAFTGSLSYRIEGACTGWTSSWFMDVVVRDSRGLETKTVWEFSSWERYDGGDYSFYGRTLNDGRLQEVTEGSARRDREKGKASGPVTVRYLQPGPAQLTVPANALFPNAHTRALVQAGMSGRPFLSTALFDGGRPEGASLVTAALKPVEVDPAAARIDNPLLKTPGWTVSMAFFSPEGDPEGQGDAIPSYEVRGIIHNNGVGSDMFQDFGSFAVNARLKTLETLPEPDCGG